jgi:hypothetical protein
VRIRLLLLPGCLLSQEWEYLANIPVSEIEYLIDLTHLLRRAQPCVAIIKELLLGCRLGSLLEEL